MSEFAVYTVDPQQSAVLVEARSNVGPIEFGSLGMAGSATLQIDPAEVGAAVAATAALHIPVRSLQSGNSLYDAELCSRLDERRFPLITLALSTAQSMGNDRFAAEGDLTIHGTTRRMAGTVALSMPNDRTVVAEGRHVVDIRDFEIRLPSMLMLKIYPDVSVQFRITAVRA